MVARKTNVVDAAFPLIGRAAELAALDGFFDEGLRLVTLLGPGGAGKTRLAIELAAARTRMLTLAQLRGGRDRRHERTC